MMNFPGTFATSVGVGITRVNVTMEGSIGELVELNLETDNNAGDFEFCQVLMNGLANLI